MSLQSRVSFGFGYGALSVAMLGYGGETIISASGGIGSSGGFTGWDGKKYHKQKEKLIKSATQIQLERIAARKSLKVEKLEIRRAQELKLFKESVLLTEQIKHEIIRLGLIEQQAKLAQSYLVREQIEQLERQIEEIDIAFVTFMLIASIDN